MKGENSSAFCDEQAKNRNLRVGRTYGAPQPGVFTGPHPPAAMAPNKLKARARHQYYTSESLSFDEPHCDPFQRVDGGENGDAEEMSLARQDDMGYSNDFEAEGTFNAIPCAPAAIDTYKDFEATAGATDLSADETDNHHTDGGGGGKGTDTDTDYYTDGCNDNSKGVGTRSLESSLNARNAKVTTVPERSRSLESPDPFHDVNMSP